MNANAKSPGAAPPPPVASGDTGRLLALNASGILGTPDDHHLDCITAMAARLFDMPICLISLVDAQRQWIKSSHGLGTRETPRAYSFCTHVVTSGEPMVIHDATQDTRFADNPLVCHPPRIRFYAGWPLRGPQGAVLGTLCVIDTRPRSFSADDLAQLRDLAAHAESRIAERCVSAAQKRLVGKLDAAEREALIDPMLRIWNYGGLRALLRLQVMVSRETRMPFAVCKFDVDGLKAISDRHGQLAGDDVLRRVAQTVREAVRPGDELGRCSGEEFLVLLPEATDVQAQSVASRLMSAVAALRLSVANREIRCRISAGVAAWTPEDPEPLDSLLNRADEALLITRNLSRLAQ